MDAEATAAREFAEETLGVFASMTVDAGAVALSSAAVAQQLRGRTHVLEIRRPLKQVHRPKDHHVSHPPGRNCDALFALQVTYQTLVHCILGHERRRR